VVCAPKRFLRPTKVQTETLNVFRPGNETPFVSLKRHNLDRSDQEGGTGGGALNLCGFAHFSARQKA